MRNAVLNIVAGLGHSALGKQALRRLEAEIAQHFGKEHLAYDWREWMLKRKAPEILDVLEIFIGECKRNYQVGRKLQQAAPDIVDRLNRLAVRHRFGYQFDGIGNARRVGSPALDEFVVGPALQAIRRPGWQEAERSFREALAHQRGGPTERDDALTAATAALEAALKAAGLKGDRLSALAKSLRNSHLVPGELKGVPDALDTLLKRSSAVRDTMSDAHGKSPDADEVPQELVDLSIYWTGSFINYLATASQASAMSSVERVVADLLSRSQQEQEDWMAWASTDGTPMDHEVLAALQDQWPHSPR
jgi:hypothetical protein